MGSAPILSARPTRESSHDDRSDIRMIDPGFHVNGTRGVDDDDNIVGGAVKKGDHHHESISSPVIQLHADRLTWRRQERDRHHPSKR